MDNGQNQQSQQTEQTGRTNGMDRQNNCNQTTVGSHGWLFSKTTMNDGEMEQHVRVLQDELQWIMADCDSKIAMGREMETQLHSTQTQLQATQMELGFVQKQLTTLQKQYQDVLEQAGYYQAQCDAFQKQSASPATSTPPLPEPAHTIITTKHTKLPDPPVFMGNLRLDDISLDIWKTKMADKIGQDEACYLNALAQLRYIFL